MCVLCRNQSTQIMLKYTVVAGGDSELVSCSLSHCCCFAVGSLWMWIKSFDEVNLHFQYMSDVYTHIYTYTYTNIYNINIHIQRLKNNSKGFFPWFWISFSNIGISHFLQVRYLWLLLYFMPLTLTINGDAL